MTCSISWRKTRHVVREVGEEVQLRLKPKENCYASIQTDPLPKDGENRGENSPLG